MKHIDKNTTETVQNNHKVFNIHIHVLQSMLEPIFNAVKTYITVIAICSVGGLMVEKNMYQCTN